jgi:CHAT domain-containing protein
MVPSASVLVALRSESPPTRGSRVLAVGDPVYRAGAPSLPRLPQSGVEAQEVAAFFPAAGRTILRREEATVENVVRVLASDGPRFGSVHLACHALIDARCPRRSGLALSDGAMLDVDRILGMRIPADLAVLSACDTARGKLAGGEGVMGFVRAFFHAGVPRVVVSSWPVSDASTLPLMRAFYEGIVLETLPPAEALRRAQRACLEEGGARAHPHHWAAFTLWGQDR